MQHPAEQTSYVPSTGDSVVLPDCRSEAYEPVKQCIACLPEQGLEITFENLKACTELTRNQLQVPILRLEKAGVLERAGPTEISRARESTPGPPTTVSFAPTAAGARLLPAKTPPYCHLRRQLADPFAFLPPARARAAECIRCMLTRGVEVIQTSQVALCSGEYRKVVKRALDYQVTNGVFTRTTIPPGIKRGTSRPAYVLTEKGRNCIAPRLIENCPQVEREQAAIIATLTLGQRATLDAISNLCKQQQKNPSLQLTLRAISEVGGSVISTIDAFMIHLIRDGYFERERHSDKPGTPYVYRPTAKAAFLLTGNLVEVAHPL